MTQGPRLLLLGLCLALSHCAVVPDTAEEAALRERPERPKMHADLVRGMLAKDQNYAALAHIEELQRQGAANPQELTLLRALALYRLDQVPEAEAAYQSLLEGPYAGQAEHGLGLIAARQDLGRAVRHFNRAVKLRPTDAEIRNDLGYTLLLAGRLTEARHHLATATELAPDSEQAKNNLVLAALVEGQEQNARRLASSLGVPQEQWRQLQAESRLIQKMIAQRSAEFTAAASTKESHYEDEKPEERPVQRQSIPGVY